MAVKLNLTWFEYGKEENYNKRQDGSNTQLYFNNESRIVTIIH